MSSASETAEVTRNRLEALGLKHEEVSDAYVAPKGAHTSVIAHYDEVVSLFVCTDAGMLTMQGRVEIERWDAREETAGTDGA